MGKLPVMFIHFLRHGKRLGQRPIQIFAKNLYILLSQRLSMRA